MEHIDTIFHDFPTVSWEFHFSFPGKIQDSHSLKMASSSFSFSPLEESDSLDPGTIQSYSPNNNYVSWVPQYLVKGIINEPWICPWEVGAFLSRFKSLARPFNLGGTLSSSGLSAPVYLPREAIPLPHRNLTSYPSQLIPWRAQLWQVGRVLSQRRRRRLQVQHPW